MEFRDKILIGAATAFGALGYANTRVEDILQESGVSRPTFYKLFESKDDVFETLSAMHHADALERMHHALVSAEGGMARLAAVIEAYLRWRAGLGRLGRVLDMETRSPHSHLVRHREVVMKTLRDQWQHEMVVGGRPQVDPLIFEAFMAAAERVADTLPFDRTINEHDIARRKAVLLRIVSATLTDGDERTPALPLHPDHAQPSPRAKKSSGKHRRVTPTTGTSGSTSRR
ncbi:TetR/AcrR family transcriptional regulator [Sandaracinus amylolyticus]|uniref:HTH tetR-type domain-containing protein n=1 Tax=Sandaracinus amylolyticus TaxID=927083 RepID=A0A0F6W0T8_9BACT|nr:TetR/AcrR family transcriptional regulator [Sandaracinus amylolyticus]AKF04542.1 hypothetical protein DB32_001691 [Sandaracinus amylolyticus]